AACRRARARASGPPWGRFGAGPRAASGGAMAAMDVGKRMMEKMGWSKGQGLGKDKQGMTSCIIMTKSKGSNTQGRIETAAPIFKNKKEKAEVKKEAFSWPILPSRLQLPDDSAVGLMRHGRLV
ncbi:unnamed protein product, partial [Prorocentrum cordatum]